MKMSFENENDYIQAWEYLMRIGVPFRYSVADKEIFVEPQGEDFLADPSILQSLKEFSGENSY